MDANAPCLSFITILEYAREPTWKFVSESVSDLLGFEPQELIGRPFMELIHPDEYAQVEQLQRDTVREDKAACIAYLRLRHKNPYKGYILCAVSQTHVHNAIVGSVSFASPGPKAMHNASTAQEVTIISPIARNFEFRRWNDPSPLPTTPVSPSALSPLHLSSPISPFSQVGPSRLQLPSDSRSAQFGVASQSRSALRPSAPPLQTQTQHGRPRSIRTAFILDRFSENCPVMYVTNEELLPTSTALGRSFFDFVVKRDEDVVRSWIEVVKGWGVNERGQPSDGGFGFGKFALCVRGRDSSLRQQGIPPSRHRHTPQGVHSVGGSHPGRSHPSPSSRPRIHSRPPSSQSVRQDDEEMSVDAIFSAHSDGLIVILRRSTT